MLDTVCYTWWKITCVILNLHIFYLETWETQPWKNKDSGGILNSLSLLCPSSFMCSIKKIHKHRLAQDIQHQSGMNVLLISLANLPFFFLEISWAWLDLIWEPWSTWTEITVFVSSRSTTRRCFLHEAGASADSPCGGGGSLDAGTEGQEVVNRFCL